MLKPIVLQIIKGVPPAPSDPNTTEAPMVTLDLLDEDGLGLEIDGWSPNLPALKNGGTWVESAVSDGRQLLASAVGNVTETMSLICGNPDIQQRFGILKTLGILQQAARDFSEGWQIDPVYLKFHAAEGIGPQYALIANIEIASRGDIFSQNSWEVTITIERRSYWRGLWPAANPLEWTFSEQGKIRGSAQPNGYDYNDMSLIDNTDHLAYQALNNCHEWGTTETTRTTQNFITIPAASIKGDAPALLCIHFDPNAVVRPKNVYIAKSTAPLTGKASTGLTRARAFSLNAGDAVATALFSISTDSDGLLAQNHASNRYLAKIASHTAGNEGSITWGTSTGFNKPDLQLYRGTYACFVRITATTGTGPVLAKLNFKEYASADRYQEMDTEYGSVPMGGNVNEWKVAYIGEIKLPFGSNSVSNLKGRGLYVTDDDTLTNNLQIRLDVLNDGGNAVGIEVADVILLPVDEGFCRLVVNATSATNVPSAIYDNTGYMSHGVEEAHGYATDLASNNPTNVEIVGDGISLTPGVDNHLIFVMEHAHNATSSITQAFKVRLNIVPQWVGLRDD